MRQVHARDAEASARHLLDRTATLGIEQPLDVLAALTRVGASAETVHRDRERLVRLLRDRAVAHRTRVEARDDRGDRLDLVERHRRAHALLEREQTAQRLQALGLLVHHPGVLAVDVIALGPRRVLKSEHRLRVEQVRRALAAPLVLAAHLESLVCERGRVVRVGRLVARGVLVGDHVDADAAEQRGGAGEVLVDELLAESDRLEGLGAGVGADDGDAHLRHDLQHTLAERLDQVLLGLLGRQALDHAAEHETLGGLHREIRVDRARAVADEEGDVVHLAHVTGLDDDADLHARLLTNQVVVHGREHQQRRDRSQVARRVAVAEHQELRPGLDRLVGLLAHLLQSLGEALGAVVDAVETTDDVRRAPSASGLEVLDLGELVVVDHGEVEQDLTRVLRSGVEQVALGPEPQLHRGDDLFADRVQRRVRHLREGLGEVVEEQARTVAQHSDRGVGTHRAERLGAVLRHRRDHDPHLFFGVAEGALAATHRRGRVRDVLALGQVCEVDTALVEPLLPRAGGGELGLDLVVLDDAALSRVDQEHAPGTQTALADDLVRREVENADLARKHHEAVVGHEETAGAQTIAVERGADERSVGEDECGGAVPRLHQHGVELVERAPGGVDVDLVLPRLRDHHHDRVRQRSTGELEQLDRLVERGRVARTVTHDREHGAQVAEHLGLELRLARPHPVAVSLHGVDLAVVRDHPERLRKWPGREGVRRVARVHEREFRGEALVGEIRVERLQLKRRHHALVYEGAARQRRQVRPELPLGALAHPERDPIQVDALARCRVGVADIVGKEQLLERRRRLASQVSEVRGVGGDLAPAEHRQALGTRDALDSRLLLGALVLVEGQEGHADRVAADGGKLERHDGAQEVVRDLRDDARTVAGAGIRADRAAVLEVTQRVERVHHDVVPGGAAQRRHHRESAGVPLTARVVETLRRGNTGEGVERAEWRHEYRPHDGAGGGTSLAQQVEGCRAARVRSPTCRRGARATSGGRSHLWRVPHPRPQERRRCRRPPSRCLRSLSQSRATTRGRERRRSAPHRGGCATGRG